MRFTIRDLLWATALVAVTLGIGIAWMRDRYELSRHLHESDVFYLEALENMERAYADALDKKAIERIKAEQGMAAPGRP
jgi:hypothetical protein